MNSSGSVGQPASHASTLKLYHFTSEDGAADISETGFRPGTDGLVWFAEHPSKVWGATSMAVLYEIETELSEVVPYRVVPEEEDWDPVCRQWGKAAQSEELVYFALPPVIASRYTPVRLTTDDRKTMMI